MKFTIERNWIDVLGHIWMPNIQAAMRIDLSSSDVANIGKPTRRNVEQWLTTHSGDFQSVDDFHAIVGKKEIAWKHEDNEFTFNDCMYPEE